MHRYRSFKKWAAEGKVWKNAGDVEERERIQCVATGERGAKTSMRA